MNKIIDLPLSAIAIDSDFQPRVGLDAEHLDLEHLERLRCSDMADWPPLLVSPVDGEGTGYFLIDGFHRYQVAKERHLQTVRCTVLPDAGYEEAFAANLKHGLPLTMEDRKAYACWLHRHYPDMSTREIAQKAGISQSTVSQITSRLIHSNQTASKRMGSDSLRGEPDAFEQLFSLVGQAFTDNTGVNKLAQVFSGKSAAQQRAEAVQRHLERYEGEERDLMVQAAQTIGQALIDGAKLAAKSETSEKIKAVQENRVG